MIRAAGEPLEFRMGRVLSSWVLDGGLYQTGEITWWGSAWSDLRREIGMLSFIDVGGYDGQRQDRRGD